MHKGQLKSSNTAKRNNSQFWQRSQLQHHKTTHKSQQRKINPLQTNKKKRSFSTNVNTSNTPPTTSNTTNTQTTNTKTTKKSFNDHISEFNANVNSSNSYQPITNDENTLPSATTIDRLRKMAPSYKPTTLQDTMNLQRGNYTVPSPFESEMVDSTQRIQQHFQLDQREEIYPSDQVNKENPQANVGMIGQLENDDDERTFSRTIFYGFGPNHVVMNGMAFQGSVLATPTMTYLWKPPTWEHVEAESVAILNFLFPQPDLILFGCGATAKPLDPSLHHYLRTLNIPYELMSTYNAMGTFNLMNEEYRKVAAFVITYDHKEHYEKEMAKQRNKDVV